MVSALRVVTARNPVHAALFLVLTFCTAAAIWMLLKAEFLAITLVLVYVGAVNVLILFAIMLVNKKETLSSIPGLLLRRVLSGAVCLGLFVLLLRVAFTTAWPLPGPLPIGEEATIRIGEHFFSDYLLPFELASVLLLMAMIGAIVLARRDVFTSDVITGEPADQGLIEKARTPLLINRSEQSPTS